MQNTPKGSAPPLPLLTVHEAADRLNVAKTAVYSLLARGELPHYRIGRAIRICDEDISSYLALRRVAAAPCILPYARHPQT
jgi:excisionase family DNA binding protein